jgi:hypothetical protein
MSTKASVMAIAMCVFGGITGHPAENWGSFPDRPLDLRDLIPPDGRRFSLAHQFDYIDPNGQRWNAPAQLIVDGATIPMPFWSVIGGPYEGLYREASAVHDAACCAKMRQWQEVHRMFYNAMRCSGVSWAKAKTMYLAVWGFGPRWTHLSSGFPKECLVQPPASSATPWKSFVIPSSSLVNSHGVPARLASEIDRRSLNLPEARAVARPFFNSAVMTDADAVRFAANLKKRPLSLEEQLAITQSVLQSELVSDDEVKAVETWVKNENPSTKALESRAEELRNRKITELRLFPEVEGLRESLQQFRSQGL